MIAQFFELPALGQLLAPNDQYESSQEEVIDDTQESSIWQIFAPDPNFSPDHQQQSRRDGPEDEEQEARRQSGPPPLAFRQEQANDDSSSVECIHCHQQTPLPAGMIMASTGSDAYSTPFYPRSGSGQQQQQLPMTPMTGTGLVTSPSDLSPKTTQEVLQAVIDTGNFCCYNQKYQNDVIYLLKNASDSRRRSSAGALEEVQNLLQQNLKQHVQNSSDDDNDNKHHPPPYYDARADGRGAICPDGCTLLMAAARKGNMWFATMLLELLDKHDEQTAATTSLVRQQLQRTDLRGRTAKHFASMGYHAKMVDLLETYEQKLLEQEQQQQPSSSSSSPPQLRREDEAVDVTGRTAWATAMTSPPPTTQMAIEGKAALQQKLYSFKDRSLLGSQAPAWQRTQAYPKIQAVFGTSHLNGCRVWNEDALNFMRWEYCPFPDSSKKEPLGFFIVCDGHGDKGSVAHKVSRELPKKLRDAMDQTTVSSDDDWTSLCTTACTTLDQELRTDKLAGGSTAIFCIVTKDKIIVANVGDSRCILIENKPTALSEISNKQASTAAAAAAAAAGETTVEQLSETMGEQLSLSSGTEGSPAVASPPSPEDTTTTAEARSSSSASSVVVTALSTDHKADIPEERERVKNSGLEVTPVPWEDEEGNQRLKVRVTLSDSNNVDFSRSFGDFDYKANKDLPEDKQAIVAIPEVRIVDRRSIACESYICICCDGVWDVKSNQDVADFVTNNVHERLAAVDTTEDDILSNVCDDLLKSSLEDGSKDNLSTIIVALSQAAEMVSPQRSVAAARHLPFDSP